VHSKAAKVSLDGLCRCAGLTRRLAASTERTSVPAFALGRLSGFLWGAISGCQVVGSTFPIAQICHHQRCQSSQRCCPNEIGRRLGPAGTSVLLQTKKSRRCGRMQPAIPLTEHEEFSMLIYNRILNCLDRNCLCYCRRKLQIVGLHAHVENAV
jgi:hypothetical protein